MVCNILTSLFIHIMVEYDTVWSHQEDSNVSNAGLFHASYIISRCKPCRISLENADTDTALESVQLFQTLIGYISGIYVLSFTKHIFI